MAPGVVFVEERQVVAALPVLVFRVGLVLEGEAEGAVDGRNLHRDVDVPGARDSALRRDPNPFGGVEAQPVEVSLPVRGRTPRPPRFPATAAVRIERAVGRDPQQLQHRLQEGRALAMRRPRVEQVGDDPREAEFVVAEVAEDVEAARQVAVKLALDRAGGVQMGRQLLQEADECALAASANALHIFQKRKRSGSQGLRTLRRTKVRRTKVCVNRDGRIRTGDPLNPIQVRYRTAPRPENA